MSSSKVQTSEPLIKGDSISSWGENPLFHATRICLAFLQNLFKQSPDGSYRWDEDRQLTRIVITDELPLHSEQVNKRPGIVTVRSPAMWNGIGLEHGKMEESVRTGMRVHSDLISSNMTFNCLSRVKVEAEQIGWLVTRHIWILQRILMRAGFHKIGQRGQILSATPAGAIISGDTEGEIHNVPVIIPYEFQWTERITPLNLGIFNEVEAAMSAFMREPESKTQRVALRGTAVNVDVELRRGRIKPPHIRGRRLPTELDRQAIESAQASGDLSINLEVSDE